MFAKLGINRVLIVLSLLVIQLFSISEVQAQTNNQPFLSENDYVKAQLHCNDDDIVCLGQFKIGQESYGKSVYQCTNYEENNCTTFKKIIFYSVDAFDVLNHYLAIDNERVRRSTNYTITFTRLETNFDYYSGSKKLIFKRYYVNNDDTSIEYLYNDDLIDSSIPLSCNGFVEGLGCPNGVVDRSSADPMGKAKGLNAIPCPCEGNPFNAINGSKIESAIDFQFPFLVTRTYSSKMKNSGMFGLNWRSNFDKSVKIYKDNNGSIKTLSFILETDDQIIFTSSDGISFSSYYSDSQQFNLSINGNYIVLTRPNGIIEYYNINNGKLMYEKNKGYTLNYQYDSYGNLYSITDSYGRWLRFYFSSYANVIEQITSFNGDVYTYTYSDGNVSTVKLNNINQIAYEYNGNLLTGKVDASGNLYAVFVYDEQGRGIENKWITTTGKELRKFNFSYDFGQTTITQGNGFIKTHLFSDNKIYSTNWNGYNQTTNYDGNGYVLSQSDFNGTMTQYNYDNAGRVISYYKSGKQGTINWDIVNNVIISMSETSANGQRTTNFTYDSNFNIMQKTITGTGDTLTWSYSWTNDGRILSETAPNGLITSYSYYTIDNSTNSGLLQSINTNGGKTLTINNYDNRGNPTSITVNGITKTMTYDYKGKLLNETVNGATNTYTYDINDNLIGVVFATGYQLTMGYDSTGRLLNIQDNMGGSSTFTLDDYTDEVLSHNIYQNNSLVRARNKTIDSLGRTTQFWNATSRTNRSITFQNYIDKPISSTDANGYYSNYGYDNNDNITNYSGNGNSVYNNYDADNNLISTSPNYQSTTMQYDDFGRIIQLNNPDTGSHSYTYNTSSRTDTHTDANGVVHTVVKNVNGNPVTISHSNSSTTEVESFSYDSLGKLSGFINNANTGKLTTTYERNTLGLISSKTQKIGSKVWKIQYEYNNLGQKVSETYPSGMVVTYGYTNGFLTSISSGGANIVSNVAYNSMLKEAVRWNLGGNSVSVNKDADGLLTGFVESGVFNQAITTDNEGHVLSLNDNVSSNNFNVYLNQNYAVQSGTFKGQNITYGIINNNNLNSINDTYNNYTVNTDSSSNRILSIINNGNQVNFQYDFNGNTLIDNKGIYTYDLRNNLLSSNRVIIENGQPVTKNVTYKYNALGQRISKVMPGGQILFFVYNENNQLIGEYSSFGFPMVEYIYFGDRPVAVKIFSGNTNIPSITYLVHTDYLGTPRLITNGGSVVWQWKNDNPYGYNQAQGSIEFNLRFAGQYYDSESGLHYNIHRTYNPEIGRYMQSDPIGLAGGSNTYNYVNRNPLNAVDPLGLWEKQGDAADLNLFPQKSVARQIANNLEIPWEIVTELHISSKNPLYVVAAHMNPYQINDDRKCFGTESCISKSAENGLPVYGTVMHITVGKANDVGINGIVNLLNENGYKKGMPIFLAGCHSGSIDDQFSIGRSVAKKYNTPVVGVIYWATYEGLQFGDNIKYGKVIGTSDEQMHQNSGNKYAIFYPNGTLKIVESF